MSQSGHNIFIGCTRHQTVTQEMAVFKYRISNEMIKQFTRRWIMNWFWVCVALVVFAEGSLVYADSLQDGWQAYLKGDYTTAARKIRKASEQGNADAQNLFGIMYSNGEGVPQSHTEAAKWYRKAAE